jgi:hypothetical protein
VGSRDGHERLGAGRLVKSRRPCQKGTISSASPCRIRSGQRTRPILSTLRNLSNGNSGTLVIPLNAVTNGLSRMTPPTGRRAARSTAAPRAQRAAVGHDRLGSHPQLPRQVVVGAVDIGVDVPLRRASLAQPIPSIVVRENTEAQARQTGQQGKDRAQVFAVAVAQEEGVQSRQDWRDKSRQYAGHPSWGLSAPPACPGNQAAGAERSSGPSRTRPRRQRPHRRAPGKGGCEKARTRESAEACAGLGPRGPVRDGWSRSPSKAPHGSTRWDRLSRSGFRSAAG